ncbi:hypothetical protein Aerorivi_01836 [Aeromonas rivipollensis]
MLWTREELVQYIPQELLLAFFFQPCAARN